MIKKHGFTLVELMVVVAIIGILAAMLAPQVSSAVDKARISKTVAELTLINNAMDSYLADVGSYPPSVQDWGRPWGADVGLVERSQVHGSHINVWNGPYLKLWPQRTAWGPIAGCGATGAYYVHIPIGWIDRDGVGGNDYWIHMNSDCARYPTMMGKVDAIIDGSDNGSAGNFRYYWWCGNGQCVYNYAGEGSRAW